jgi:hypothetical protein
MAAVSAVGLMIAGAGASCFVLMLREAPDAHRTPPKSASVEIHNKTIDLGVVKSGTRTMHTFAVENRGPAPVGIADVRKSCSCAAIALEYAKTDIPPGKTATIRCAFQVEPGPQSFALFVAFSNGAGDRIAVAYDGTRPFALAASRIEWDAVAQGKASGEKEVILYGDGRYWEKALDISFAGQAPEWLSCRLQQLTGVPPRGESRVPLARIRFSVAAGAPRGPFSVVLTLRLVVDGESHEFPMECRGVVTSPIYATPGRLVLLSPSSQPVYLSVKSADEPFSVSTVQTDMGTCSLLRLSGRETRVTFTLAPDAERKTGALLLTLDHPTVSALSIPVTVLSR